jgi:lactoylglutathione lyase
LRLSGVFKPQEIPDNAFGISGMTPDGSRGFGITGPVSPVAQLSYPWLMLPDFGGEPMKYLHTMVRVTDLGQSLDFYVKKLGLEELRRIDRPEGRYTLVFLAAPGDTSAQIELTYNWDPETYGEGRNFGHVAYEVDNIYETCQRLMQAGVTINRPPRDGRMAFVRSPDNISFELLQKGPALAPAEPWMSMPNTGKW